MGVIGQQDVRGTRLVWRGRSVAQLLPLAAIVAGLTLGGVALIIYIARGYSRGMLWLWLAGIAIAIVGFALRSRTWPRFAWVEALYAAGAAAVCAPLYLVALYRWPVQVGSDEVAIATTSRDIQNLPGVDPLGASFYLTRPALLFVFWGRLGHWIGGIDLYHMRLLHALAGLLTVALCYALFRVLRLPPGWAFLGAVLVGVNHSMFMISRLAMRENTAVLVLVVSFVLLLWGLRHSHELAIFLGGIAAGLGFYVYEPGRVAFPIWMAFLVGVGLLYKRRFAVRRLLVVGAITTTGFLLAATPIIYADSQIPSSSPYNGQKESLLVYDRARTIQQHWVFADSQFGGWLKNVRYGLSTFNNHVVDHSWTYANYGHGFLDPVTGIVLWLGVVVVGLALVRRRSEDEGALLMLGGFVTLWLSLAFLVNKAPNYTRLLITLPFVAYLAVQALRWATDRWRSVRFAPQLIVGGFVVAVVAFNLAIAWDYVQKGRTHGDAIGSTGRYVRAHQNDPGQKFFIVTSDDAPYYVWGDVSAAMERLRFFATRPGVVQQPVDPHGVSEFTAVPPFALLMRRHVWAPAATELSDRYPRGRLRNITPDGERVVLEVPS